MKKPISLVVLATAALSLTACNPTPEGGCNLPADYLLTDDDSLARTASNGPANQFLYGGNGKLYIPFRDSTPTDEFLGYGAYEYNEDTKTWDKKVEI